MHHMKDFMGFVLSGAFTEDYLTSALIVLPQSLGDDPKPKIGRADEATCGS